MNTEMREKHVLRYFETHKIKKAYKIADDKDIECILCLAVDRFEQQLCFCEGVGNSISIAISVIKISTIRLRPYFLKRIVFKQQIENIKHNNIT